MIGLDPKDDFCFLWPFMIDQKYQKKSFGKRALELLFEHLKAQTNVISIITCYHEASGDPSGFYKKIGFVEADEMVKHSELGKRIQEAGEFAINRRK